MTRRNHFHTIQWVLCLSCEYIQDRICRVAAGASGVADRRPKGRRQQSCHWCGTASVIPGCGMAFGRVRHADDTRNGILSTAAWDQP